MCPDIAVYCCSSHDAIFFLNALAFDQISTLGQIVLSPFSNFFLRNITAKLDWLLWDRYPQVVQVVQVVQASVKWHF